VTELWERLKSPFGGPDGPQQVVPPSGISSWLIVFAAAAMSFLAIAALAFSLSADRLAANWSDEIASTATIRISAPVEQLELQTEAALRVLQTTPGIAKAEVMSRQEQASLLAPWIGPNMPLEEFSLPTLIALEETKEGPDREGLRLRLRAEAPGAVYDDHGAWREPIVAAASRVERIGFLALVLVIATLVAIVVVTAQAAIVSNSEVIRTLRLIGARDIFIVRAFVRRLTVRAVIGALVGVLLGIVVVAAQPDGADDTFLTGFGLIGSDYMFAVLLPLIVGAMTFFAARVTIFSMLKRLA